MAMIKRFNDLIVAGAKYGYSDIHLTGGQPLVFRKDGNLNFDRSAGWTYQDIDALAKKILNKRQLEMLRSRLSVDFAASVHHIRIRINIFNTIRGLSLAIRLLPGTVPTLDKLNLHHSLQSIAELKSGLVLICGTTGCGKTTTIASILDEINHSRAAHIITLEDPIEYRIKSIQSFVEQREIGPHAPTVEQGLIDVMREDPDVVMVGELRDHRTIRLTLDSAESGHLVIGTLHATNTEDAIHRIINSAPLEAEEQIRYQLASTLSWVIIQQLVYSEKVGYRLPLLSILRGTQQVKGIIRDKKFFQIENAMHTGKMEGMFTMDRYEKEYLNMREKFHSPVTCFRPSAESVHDPAYRSSIFDLESPVSVTPDQESFDYAEQITGSKLSERKTKGKDATPVIQDSYDAHYEIEETVNLEDVLAQTEESLSSKTKRK